MIKLTALFLSLALLSACKAMPVSDTVTSFKSDSPAPEWYSGQGIKVAGYWVGYGDALTLEQAKAVARADLAATFKSEISASLRIDQNLNSDTLEQHAQSRIEQFTSAEFEDLDVLRSEQHLGRYFIVLGHDHRPLAQRLAVKLRDIPLESTRPQQLPQSSRLYQQLIKVMSAVPPLNLNHERGRYLISAGRLTVPVRDNEIESLIPQPRSNVLELALTPNMDVYAPETLFKVSLSTQQAGYLSYLQVFGNGAVVLMLANHPVNAGDRIHYPDPALYDGLITELPSGQTSTSVKHLTMVCPDQRNLSRLEHVSSRANEQYQSFLLGELNRWFAGCDGQSLLQRIRP